jgi:DNA-binding PadR family transcriptional regulator
VGRNFFKQGELPLALLALIGRRSLNGYELLDELSRLFGPTYQPSPGGVYPALKALLDERLIEVDGASKRREYRLTSAGKKALDQRSIALADIENRTATLLAPKEGLEALLARFTSKVLVYDGHVSSDKVEQILNSAAAKIDTLSKQTRKERSNVG